MRSSDPPDRNPQILIIIKKIPKQNKKLCKLKFNKVLDISKYSMIVLTNFIMSNKKKSKKQENKIYLEVNFLEFSLTKKVFLKGSTYTMYEVQYTERH